MPDFTDRLGRTFADYRKVLPLSVVDWPQPVRIKSPENIAAYRRRFARCQVCGSDKDGIHVHHIVGGTKGRDDSRTNLISLCPPCHGNANGSGLPRGLILWCKWRTDLKGTDWATLAYLHRAFLPDLIVDPAVEGRYNAIVGKRPA